MGPISFTIKVKIIEHPIVQWKENQFKNAGLKNFLKYSTSHN